jgi:hypothetical protein
LAKNETAIGDANLRADVRDKYDLESLWGDAPRVRPAKPRKKTASEAA